MCMNAQYLCRDILRQYVTDDDVERSAKRKDLFLKPPLRIASFQTNECLAEKKQFLSQVDK